MNEETCKRAVQAAVSVMQETCGGKVVPLGDLFVHVPPVVLDIAAGKHGEDALQAVSHSQWVKGWAKRACEMATGKPDRACMARMARMLAEAVVEG